MRRQTRLSRVLNEESKINHNIKINTSIDVMQQEKGNLLASMTAATDTLHELLASQNKDLVPVERDWEVNANDVLKRL